MSHLAGTHTRIHAYTYTATHTAHTKLAQIEVHNKRGDRLIKQLSAFGWPSSNVLEYPQQQQQQQQQKLLSTALPGLHIPDPTC